MSPADVLGQVNSLEAFRSLLTEESLDSFFDWDPVIQRLQSQLDMDDLFEMAQLVGKDRGAATSLASLSEELYRRGDRPRAWIVGELALAHSSSYGWARWADGGSRLAAFKALSAVDPERTKPLMYRQLAEDGGGHAESLSEVLLILAPTLSVPAIWEEIERFCHGMFPEATLPEGAPLLPQGVTDDRPLTAFADLFRYLLTHPVSLLRESARRACLELVLAGDDVARELLQKTLAADEAQQEQALVVVGAVRARDSNAVRPFLTAVRNCAHSPHWLVRRMAQRLLRAAGEAVPEAPRRRLPPIYEFALPERPNAPEANLPPPPPDEPIVQFGSAEELIVPFGDYLQLVASRGGIGYRNAVERAAHLMRQITPEEEWSADAERRLRSQLSSALLELPFVRPRAGVARRAVFRVAAELVDAERIAPSDLDAVEGLCVFYDEVLEGQTPNARDRQVVPPLSLGQTGRSRDWVNLNDPDFPSFAGETPDGRTVLAQSCKLKTLDWGTPTEERESTTRATERVVQPSEDESLFGRVSFRRVVEYPEAEPSLPTYLRHGPPGSLV